MPPAAKLLKLLPICLAACLFQLQAFPAEQSSYTLRVTNRRYISHILYELRGERHFITLTMTHPRHWAFHARSHALYYPCRSLPACMKELRKLDTFLKTGSNLSLKLNGSQIREIIYHPL